MGRYDSTNEKRAVRRIVAANAPLQTQATFLISIDFPLVIQTRIQIQHTCQRSHRWQLTLHPGLTLQLGEITLQLDINHSLDGKLDIRC